jgi:hypothetical protein
MQNGKMAPQKKAEDNCQTIILSDDLGLQTSQSLEIFTEIVCAGKKVHIRVADYEG